MLKHCSQLLILGLFLLVPQSASPYGGTPPAGLPQVFAFGVNDKHDAYAPAQPHDWKVGQGNSCWDYSYAYLTPGWTTWWSEGGQNWAGREISYWGSLNQNQVFTFYYSYGSPAYFQSASNMATYWSELKSLFQQINTYATTSRKTIVHFEPDGIGFWRQNNVSVSATGTVMVGGATGPDATVNGLAWNTTNFPNSLQGWSKAIYHMRAQYSGGKALLAHHYTHWATGTDVLVQDVNQSQIDAAIQDMTNYISSIENGLPFDLIFADPSDRDADWWRKCRGDNTRWTSTDHTATSGVRSFGKLGYVMDRVSTNLSRRMVLWQIPVGNTYYKTVNNSDGHYRDNHAQNILPCTSATGASGTPGDAYSPSDATKGPLFWANRGVIAVLFGSGYYGGPVDANYGSCGPNSNLCHVRDYKNDGITNPTSDNPTGSGSSWGVANSTVSDDDGGYIRNAVSRYCTVGKIALPGTGPTPTFTRTPTVGSPTATPTSTFTPTPIYCRPLDDLEDGNLVNYYNQTWISFKWPAGAGATISSPLNAALGANGTSRSMAVTGSNTAADGSNGWGLKSPLAASGGVSVTPWFAGLSFYIRASAATTIRANLESAAQASGSDYWGYNLAITQANTWIAVTILKAQFTQGGWGTTIALNTALDQLSSINWQTQGVTTSNLVLYVDQVCLLDPTPPPTFTFTPTPTRTPTANPNLVCYSVDNLEDGNLTNDYAGNWISFKWPTTGAGVTVGTPVNDTIGANGTARSARVSGTNTAVTMGWGMKSPLGTGTGVNLSSWFDGISFWARASAAATFRVNLESYATQADSDHYGATVILGTAWTYFKFENFQLSQKGFGTPVPLSTALQQILGLSWQTDDVTNNVTLWVDEVCIQSDNPPPTATFTRTPTATPTANPNLTCYLVDDLEDANLTNNLGYGWATYKWPSTGAGVTVISPPLNDASGANGTTRSVRVSGTNTAVTMGWGVKTILDPGTGANLSAWLDGVSFWARASAATTFRVNLESGATAGDSDHYGVTIVLGTNWTQYRLEGFQFSQKGFGTPVAWTTALQQAQGISWQTEAITSNLTFWVDEVCLLTDNPPPTPTFTPSPTRTPTATSTFTPTFTTIPATFTFTVTRTPSPTATVTSTRTDTPSPTLTSTRTMTPTPSHTRTGTPTFTATVTATYTNTTESPTFTWTLTRTETRTATPTNTWTPTRTFTLSPTETATRTPTFTGTVMPFTATDTFTRTPTNSPTATRTATSTFTPTSTRTPSDTPTDTATRTVTATRTETRTPTSSFTATETRTPTDTRTPTNTPTMTWTRTDTATRTVTNTPTETGTPTDTRTPTPTRTPTASFTVTNTPTVTMTRTVTNTRTETGTPTETRTPTDTRTPTNSPTVTWTRTETSTRTVTNTPTVTWTRTETGTPTYTFTHTYTRTPTYTRTITDTPTVTFTRTVTPTRTETGTPTASRTPTDTRTLTPTRTGTPTRTETFTATHTGTRTESPTLTPTETRTSTPSFTFTRTFTGTRTPTPTPTPTLPGTSIGEPYPNPSSGEPVEFDLGIQKTSTVKWSVFTTAYRKIRTETLVVTGNRRVSWDLRDSKGLPVASGVYYIRFEVDGPMILETVRKVMVLR